MSSAERGPFGGGFLDPAFAEVALARRDQRGDVVRRMGLGYRDQRDIRRSAPCLDRGGANRLSNQREPGPFTNGQNCRIA